MVSQLQTFLPTLKAMNVIEEMSVVLIYSLIIR